MFLELSYRQVDDDDIHIKCVHIDNIIEIRPNGNRCAIVMRDGGTGVLDCNEQYERVRKRLEEYVIRKM